MGIPADCAKKLIKFFQEQQPTFPKSDSSKTMTVGGKRYAYDDHESVKRLIPAETAIKYEILGWWQADPAEKMEYFVNFVEGTYRTEMVMRRQAQKALHQKMSGPGKDGLTLPDANYILEHLQAFRILGDVRREAAIRFFDLRENHVTDYDYYAIQSALKSGGIDKESIETFFNRVLHAREVYDPKNNFLYRLVEGSNAVYEVNLHRMPAWRLAPPTPTLDADIEKFMAHLFPVERDREFVYTWIYHSLTLRAGTYLYLCGGQASGKTTLANLISSLHGFSNSSYPKLDSLTGRFNHYLKHKSFVFFDEFNCRNRTDKDILKNMINDKIQIEGKGRDHEDIVNYGSYMLVNNSLEAIGIEPIDRRFSVPEVNNAMLTEAYGVEWVEKFSVRVREDAAMAANFGWWVLENFKAPKWGRETAYQTARFEEIVLATARMGILEMLPRVFKREQNTYKYYDEKSSFHRQHKGQHYPPIQDWTKFFKTVKYGGELLGTVDAGTFTPRLEFQKNPGEEEVMA